MESPLKRKFGTLLIVTLLGVPSNIRCTTIGGSDNECRQFTGEFSCQGEENQSPDDMPQLYAGYAVKVSM